MQGALNCEQFRSFFILKESRFIIDPEWPQRLRLDNNSRSLFNELLDLKPVISSVVNSTVVQWMPHNLGRYKVRSPAIAGFLRIIKSFSSQHLIYLDLIALKLSALWWLWGGGITMHSHLSNQSAGLQPVWPEKNRQMSINVAQKW